MQPEPGSGVDPRLGAYYASKDDDAEGDPLEADDAEVIAAALGVDTSGKVPEALTPPRSNNVGKLKAKWETGMVQNPMDDADPAPAEEPAPAPVASEAVTPTKSVGRAKHKANWDAFMAKSSPQPQADPAPTEAAAPAPAAPASEVTPDADPAPAEAPAPAPAATPTKTVSAAKRKANWDAFMAKSSPQPQADPAPTEAPAPAPAAPASDVTPDADPAPTEAPAPAPAVTPTKTLSGAKPKANWDAFMSGKSPPKSPPQTDPAPVPAPAAPASDVAPEADPAPTEAPAPAPASPSRKGSVAAMASAWNTRALSAEAAANGTAPASDVDPDEAPASAPVSPRGSVSALASAWNTRASSAEAADDGAAQESDVASPSQKKKKAWKPPEAEKCWKCKSRLYAADRKVSVDGKLICIGRCFRCEDCNCKLTLSNYTIAGSNALLCKTHYFVRFNTTNSYGGEERYSKSAKAAEDRESESKAEDDGKSKALDELKAGELA